MGCDPTVNKQPVDTRADPLAHDSRGAARHEEIRTKAPMLSAPRQSNRPTERSGQNRAHTR
jgi:hypothetical protein